LNDEYLALAKRLLGMIIRFATLYLCKAALSSIAVIKTKYWSRINLKQNAGGTGAVSQILPRFN